MRCRPLLVVLLLALAPAAAAAAAEARAEVTRTVRHELAAGSTTILDITHSSGDVRVQTWPAEEPVVDPSAPRPLRGEQPTFLGRSWRPGVDTLTAVRVSATIRVGASTAARANAFAGLIELRAVDAGPRIEVGATAPPMNGWDDVGFSVDVSVTAPRAMPVHIRSGPGHVGIYGMSGDVTVTHAHGRLIVADGEGTYRLENRFGLVDVARFTGTLTVVNSNERVRLTDISGTTTVRARFGVVETIRVAGALHIENANGDVGAQLAAPGGACRDVALSTEHGRLRVSVPNAGYAVHARAMAGRILNAVPMMTTGPVAGRNQTSTLSGTIGGGGCRLELVNTGGDIEIVRGR